MLVGSSKVSSIGQITIPQKIREKYGIKKGDTVYFIEENGKLIIKKVSSCKHGAFAPIPSKQLVGPSLFPLLPPSRIQHWRFRRLSVG